MKTFERASKVLDMLTRRPPPPSMAEAFAQLDADQKAAHAAKLVHADRLARRTTQRLAYDTQVAPAFAVNFEL